MFWDVVDGQTVVCDAVAGELYRLNEVAAFLWEACDEASLESLTARLASAFHNEDIQRLRSDVSSFVSSMAAKNLLVVDASSNDVSHHH